MPAVSSKSLACIQALLKVLTALFHALPSTLPNNVYAFHEFSASTDISAEDIDDYGSVEGALNHYLECKLAPRGRKDGVQLLGRGPGLEAVVKILDTYITLHPENVLLQKWVDDLEDAARRAGSTVCFNPCPLNI
jgi:hypothetical protein